MHTKDLLAAALEAAALPDMAAKAREGYYHDFLSPLDTPVLQLAGDLAEAGTPASLEVRKRVINGEFDATREESDEWAKSPDGQNAFKELLGPTGEFPEGKTDDTDEGALRIAISHEGENVVIRFGKKVAWVGMPKADAMNFAATVIKHAQALK